MALEPASIPNLPATESENHLVRLASRASANRTDTSLPSQVQAALAIEAEGRDGTNSQTSGGWRKRGGSFASSIFTGGASNAGARPGVGLSPDEKGTSGQKPSASSLACRGGRCSSLAAGNSEASLSLHEDENFSSDMQLRKQRTVPVFEDDDEDEEGKDEILEDRHLDGKGEEEEDTKENLSTVKAVETTSPAAPTGGDQEKGETTEKDIYDRFSLNRKRGIVAVVAYAGLLAPFASSSFLPSIPQMAKELHSSGEVINYTVAIYLVVIGVAPLGWAGWGRVYGRRAIYLTSLPIFVIGSMGVALCSSIWSLILTRIIQGAGASSVLSIGAGTIGDIYRPTERGRAMGIYYLGALLGPAVSPVIAGALTTLHPGNRFISGWRDMQWTLLGMGVLALVLTIFFLPETMHSRVLQEEKEKEGSIKKEKFKFVWVNPLKPLALLRYPNILVISLNSSLVFLTNYTIIVPLDYTFSPRYGITSPAVMGAIYLASGCGNMLGSRFGGIYSDWVVKRWIKHRNGKWIPEDRLYASLIGGGLVLPGSVLAYGWIIQTGAGGIGLGLVMLGITGVGLMLILSSLNTYCVDIIQNRSAEVIATNNCLRYIFAAGASAGVLPLTKAINVGPANSIAAAIGWLGFCLTLLVIKFGEKWRDNAENNKSERKSKRERDIEEGGIPDEKNDTDFHREESDEDSQPKRTQLVSTSSSLTMPTHIEPPQKAEAEAYTKR